MVTFRELKPIYSAQKSFYKKAYVKWYYGDKAILYSYGTPVCAITYKDNKIHRLWGGYSRTTMNHVNEFIAQYFFLYFHEKLSKKDWYEMIVDRSCY